MYFNNKKIVKFHFSDYWALVFFTIIVISFRTETGGDWDNYYRNFKIIGEFSQNKILAEAGKNITEISQTYLFWTLYQFSPNYGYYIYHSIAVFFGLFALYLFAKEQPYFWLTITISIPFFLIIMIMGYTRQGIALSFILIGLYYLKRFKVKNFTILTLIAATFHTSAIVMTLLAIPYIFHKNFKYKTLLMSAIFIIAMLGISLIQDYLDEKTKTYITSGMVSAGAMPRILINVLAASFLFYFRDRWQQVFGDFQLWRIYALAAFATLPALLMLPSTSVDRLALYLIPLQLAVWPRIIYLAKPAHRDLLALGILGGYGLTLHVWLNYANNVYMWLPFKHLFLSF